MHLRSLLLTLLHTLALARAFPYPEAVNSHDLYIRTPAVAVADLPADNLNSIFYHSKSVHSTRNSAPESHHSLRTRASPKPDKSDKSVTSNKPSTSTSGETYARKSPLRPRSPADIHLPSSLRYTPAICAEPECEKICICYQEPGGKKPKVVSYPWVQLEEHCIDYCLHEVCSCAAHGTS